MEKAEMNKLTLDRLCEYAELHATAKNDLERFNADQRAYEFLAYSGFNIREMVSYTNNYNRLKKEINIIH